MSCFAKIFREKTTGNFCRTDIYLYLCIADSKLKPWSRSQRAAINIMYRIFISHSWKYSNQYDKIVEFLDDGGVTYYNHSVPKDDPVHTNGTDKQLEDAIDAKIKGCSCVIILAGVYSSCSKWIKKEIAIAQKYGKPIISVRPWGAERVSDAVTQAADIVVGWNATSVANAVKNYSL